MFGFDRFGGNFYPPRKIMALINHGWKLILIASTYEWLWWCYRYGEHEGVDTEEDAYGRIRSVLVYNGWYTKVDVLKEGEFEQYRAKGWWCAPLDEDVVLYDTIPEEINEFIAFNKWRGEYIEWYGEYKEWVVE